MTFVLANKVAILACLLAVSEVLGAVPSIKANGIFEFIVGILKSMGPK